jgi:hypothetical protein
MIFCQKTGVPFDFDVLKRDDALIARELAMLGKKIFLRMISLCERR